MQNNLVRWLLWGAFIGAVVAAFRTDFAAAGTAFNISTVAGGAVGGIFLSSLIWSARQWAGRKPKVKF